MWSDPPQTLFLKTREAHVWRAPLEQPPERVDAFLRTLNDDERARASRFHFDKHRRHFVVARGVLRLLLGRYLETRPEDVVFAYGSHGKPTLGGEHRGSSLRFNASHSGELALYAFVRDYEVGVDVEYIKEDFTTEEIARRYFTTREVETLLAMSKADRPAGFFRFWARKESYIKAIGTGLSHPLNEFDVSLAIPGWTITDLDAGSGYAAALAIEGPPHQLITFDLRPA